MTLTAKCIRSPQVWQWSGPGCIGSLLTCHKTTSAVAGPVSYTVAATNVIGAGTGSCSTGTCNGRFQVATPQ